MITKRHLVLNLVILVVPWLSLLFLGKRNVKRYTVAGVFIVVFAISNQLVGHMRKWWRFYNKVPFLKGELPFSMGPFMPLSMWILKNSYVTLKNLSC